MGFLFNRLGFFISDIISPFVRLIKLDIQLSLLLRLRCLHSVSIQPISETAEFGESRLVTSLPRFDKWTAIKLTVWRDEA